MQILVDLSCPGRRFAMGSMTVRKIDDEVIRDLRVSAARRGVSMEQEARDRLRQPLREIAQPDDKTPGWRLKATKAEILATLDKLPAMDFDQKEATDRLYDYLDEQKW
jgi:plasmid stability protein